ncbi:hypothetical protein [Actinomadura algeriensis]|uniref:Energy-coupling factor transporter ATP-binding protein EcfA2 n=1 Tax=Actinomadura algeriensis TaxID=1679523 RepID=A0ABR9JJH7_9ACTN|nr:hypothetical protein [Actinomadura algeriensis]MBE1530708.1 energy-coupling factor transporter ATP-binding protein EcfA2 [Actinomadura algeriensis]
MAPDRPRHLPSPDHNIAMWGATGSGKTTFLAALDIALNRSDDVDWRVIGANDASTDVLVDLSSTLAVRNEFPERTEGMEQYQWRLIGETEHREGRMWNRRTVRRAHTLGLDLYDASGEWFDNDFMGDREPMLQSLTKSRGIVYLFDPIREFKVGDAYKSLDGMLARLAQRMLNAEDAPADGRLPHHVAVCTTKFDEVRVLQTAEHLGLLDYDADEHGCPRVTGDEEARELFRELCSVSATGTAELVLRKLTRYFREDRIRFFATSAVGFHLDPAANGFNGRDFQNVVPDAESTGGFRIRSGVRPINVMEPVLWLAERLADASAASVLDTEAAR